MSIQISRVGDLSSYTVQSSGGISMRLLSLGATLTSLRVPDADGRPGEVTLGYATDAEYVSKGNVPYFGSTVGRFANRIAGGVFALDGHTWKLERNDGDRHHLHGGRQGFARQPWEGRPFESREGEGVRFHLSSPDGDQGYPGEMEAFATYTLSPDGVLSMDYEAWTDAPTIVNLTNHVYWNLATTGLVLDHVLRLDAARVLEVDDTIMPTGRVLSVDSTAFDFRVPHRLGERIGQVGLGYDHCYVVDGGGGADPAPVATLWDPASGRMLSIATTQPGVQLYTGNFLDRAGFRRHQALCLETQYYPDSPNRPEFPSPVLRPGQIYRQSTRYRFSKLR